METLGLKPPTNAPSPDRIFWIMPQPRLVSRLATALSESGSQFSEGPLAYLRVALLPERLRDWLPIRTMTLVGSSLAHPIEVFRGIVAADAIDPKRRRRLAPILSISAAIHSVLIVYLIYLAFFSPFAHLRLVNKAYRKFDPDLILAPLYYPPQILRQAQPGTTTMSLEEIRARAEKHKEELARAKEKAEKEKKEKEEADRKAAEEAAKVAAEKKPQPPAQFGEINEAPIKDTIGKLYEMFQAGGLDIPEMKFEMWAGFKVEPDGSLSNVRIIKSSGSKIIDTKALEILWNIGESHALGPVSDLSTATISLKVDDKIARLRITAFAQTPEIAKAKADLLNILFGFMKMAQKNKSPDIAELLSLIHVSSRGKFVDTDLVVPRERAAEMLKARFEHPGTPPR
jgi:hypothetical protein